VSLACAALCIGLAASGSAAGPAGSAAARQEVDPPRSSRTDRVFASAPLVALGRWSYGIYLWHFPLIGVLVWSAGLPADGTNRSVALAILLATPLSIAAGAASHRLIEQPARQWAARRTAKPAVADGSPLATDPNRPTTS
jgi:peptidoglycan/LPS O-acetylase OafA/YrhL